MEPVPVAFPLELAPPTVVSNWSEVVVGLGLPVEVPEVAADDEGLVDDCP